MKLLSNSGFIFFQDIYRIIHSLSLDDIERLAQVNLQRPT